MATISGIKSHVKRIANPKGGIDSDGAAQWFVDVERIDFFWLETGAGNDYQRYGVSLHWMDEGVTDGSSANPSRTMVPVRLTATSDDPTTAPFVDVPIVGFYATRRSDDWTQAYGNLLDNAEGNQGRVWIDHAGGEIAVVVNAITNVEDRLNAGENVNSDEYDIVTYEATDAIEVAYLAFYSTQIDGQRIGNLMPLTPLVQRINHLRGGPG